MADRIDNRLFLCTHDCARGIPCEGPMNHFGRGRFRVVCAGGFREIGEARG